jgi:molybdenum cofactor guanylyltransferase
MPVQAAPTHLPALYAAPMTSEPMTGLLLAGGRSTRMGTDKATLTIAGVSLAERVAAVLTSCCESVLVASGDGRRLAWLGLPQVADVTPDAGPLAGIVAGLEAAETALVAVCAVDLPEASAAVLRALEAVWSGEPCVVPEVDGRLQPLHAVWSRAAAPALRAELDDGHRSVLRAVAHLGGRVAGPPVWAPADATGRFARNVNRPEDL